MGTLTKRKSCYARTRDDAPDPWASLGTLHLNVPQPMELKSRDRQKNHCNGTLPVFFFFKKLACRISDLVYFPLIRYALMPECFHTPKKGRIVVYYHASVADSYSRRYMLVFPVSDELSSFEPVLLGFPLVSFG